MVSTRMRAENVKEQFEGRYADFPHLLGEKIWLTI